jgi:hypothetical protein
MNLSGLFGSSGTKVIPGAKFRNIFGYFTKPVARVHGYDDSHSKEAACAGGKAGLLSPVSRAFKRNGVHYQEKKRKKN